MMIMKRFVSSLLTLAAYGMMLTGCQKVGLKRGTSQIPDNPAPPISSPQITSDGIGGYNYDNAFDKSFAWDYGHKGIQDYIVCYRPKSKILWVIGHNPLLNPTDFYPIYQSFNGIGTYDLLNSEDLVVPFDYEHSGKQDYFLCYRPGGHYSAVVRNNNHFPNTNQGFTTVISNAAGIGGFDLNSQLDRLIPFDYTHSGKLDHVIAIRGWKGNGYNQVWILKNNDNGSFSPVYKALNGIDGIQFTESLNYTALPFDYEHTGRQDYMVIYGTDNYYLNGISSYGCNLWVFRNNNNGTFTNVNHAAWAHTGAGSIDYNTTVQCSLFDFDHSGKLDHLLIYIPGPINRRVDIIKNVNGTFVNVFHSDTGIGGWDLLSGSDRIFAYDYESSGKQDYLVITRASQKNVTILKHNPDGSFVQVL